MLSLIVPTKGRPDDIVRLLKSIDVPLSVMICATKQEDLPQNLLVLNEFVDVNFTIEDCSVITAINKAARLATNTFVVICDDMEFLPGSLSKAMSIIDDNKVLGFLTANIPDAVPIPCIGINYYHSMGQLANPEYKHFFWDQETIDVAIERGQYKLVTEFKLLNHYHPNITKKYDETHNHQRSEKITNDEQIYRSRLLHR